jgi:hypothetical protein
MFLRMEGYVFGHMEPTGEVAEIARLLTQLFR